MGLCVFAQTNRLQLVCFCWNFLQWLVTYEGLELVLFIIYTYCKFLILVRKVFHTTNHHMPFFKASVNLLWPRDTILCHTTWSSLIQVISCRLFGTKPLLTYQKLFIVEWTHGNKFQTNLNHNTKVFFEKIHMKMLSAPCPPFCFSLNIFSGLFCPFVFQAGGEECGVLQYWGVRGQGSGQCGTECSASNIKWWVFPHVIVLK